MGAKGGGVVGRVDDLEALRQLKARYFRLLDTKDWSAFEALFSTDASFDIRSGDGGSVIHGAAPFVDHARSQLSDAISVHHGHMPELTLTSELTATGIWAFEDEIWFPPGHAPAYIHGYGHYHETYVNGSSGWRIASLRLTRLRVIEHHARGVIP
jgi:hypothetical protein